MHREIKEVVRRCLLAWLIKNSVNEAALSPQIEQMDTRQQRRYPSPQTQAASRGEDVCVLVFTCVWERCFVNISFCIMNAVLCRPQSHTHTQQQQQTATPGSFLYLSDWLSSPLPKTSPRVFLHLCVCVCVSHWQHWLSCVSDSRMGSPEYCNLHCDVCVCVCQTSTPCVLMCRLMSEWAPWSLSVFTRSNLVTFTYISTYCNTTVTCTYLNVTSHAFLFSVCHNDIFLQFPD